MLAVKMYMLFLKQIDLDASDGCYTFLQLACDRGMWAAARFLLVSGADPGGVTANLATPPLVLAGHHGYHRVLALFRDVAVAGGGDGGVDFGATDAKDENVLHRQILEILKYRGKSTMRMYDCYFRVLKAESKAYHNHQDRNYSKCLAMLLDYRNPAVLVMIQPAIDSQVRTWILWGCTVLYNTTYYDL